MSISFWEASLKSSAESKAAESIKISKMANAIICHIYLLKNENSYTLLQI